MTERNKDIPTERIKRTAKSAGNKIMVIGGTNLNATMKTANAPNSNAIIIKAVKQALSTIISLRK